MINRMVTKPVSMAVVAIALLVSGCGNESKKNNGSDNGSKTPATSTTTISGTAVDGYISNATACLDKNVNGTCDSDEPTVQTNENGKFIFTDIDVNSSNLLIPVIVTGGTDMATGKPFQGSVSGIINTTDANKIFIASPLTSLVTNVFIASKDKSLTTLTNIKKKIASSLDINVTKLDANPMKDKKVFVIVQMIQQTKQLILTSAMKHNSGSMIKEELSKSIEETMVASVQNGSDVNRTKIIVNLQKKQADISIPSNEQDFISKQTTEIKNTLDKVVTKPSVTIDNLVEQQKHIETVLEEASKRIENAEYGSIIPVIGAPVANAGNDQNVNTAATVTLNGSKSSDADSDTLTYKWSIVSKPAGSNATLSDTTVVKPTFTADVDGAYVISLVVNDGAVDSVADRVIVTATTAGPVDGYSTYKYRALDVAGTDNSKVVTVNGVTYTILAMSETNVTNPSTSGDFTIAIVTVNNGQKSQISLGADYLNTKVVLKVYKSTTTFDSTTFVGESSNTLMDASYVDFGNIVIQ